jgi:hypothetical protein
MRWEKFSAAAAEERPTTSLVCGALKQPEKRSTPCMITRSKRALISFLYIKYG